jgi:hypothetical protein
MVTTFTHGLPWARARRFNTLITDSVLSRALVDSKLTNTIIHVILNTCFLVVLSHVSCGAGATVGHVHSMS